MSLPHMSVTTAIAALATLVLAACTDRPGPTAVNTEGSAERAVADPASAPALSQSSGIADRRARAPASIGWQAEGRSLVVAGSLSPIVATRVYALLGVAQYGAVVNAGKHGDDDDDEERGHGFGNGGRRTSEAERGAVAGASVQILSFLFPTAAAPLEQRLRDEGNAGPGRVHPRFTRGVAVGRRWGDVMIAWANADGFSNPWTGTIPVGPGFWTRNPAIPPAVLPPAIAGPQFGAMKPYFLTSPGQFHSPTPPAVGSPAFLTDLTEVSEISRTRTPEQLAAAVALNLSSGTITSLGRFDELASQYIGERRFDERAAAHVFALTNAAAMDAVIGCWEAKFSYFYIRPSQVNPPIGPPITLPIGLPNHPSYPSGHSCVSAAAAEVLKAFFPEHAATLDAQVVANGMSRIYAGIHYRFDITAGQALGRAVAKKALKFDRHKGLLAAVR